MPDNRLARTLSRVIDAMGDGFSPTRDIAARARLHPSTVNSYIRRLKYIGDIEEKTRWSGSMSYQFVYRFKQRKR